MGCFVYTVFGTAKDITIGPVAIMSLLVATFALSPIPGDATYAVLITFIGGFIQLAMGLLNIGRPHYVLSHNTRVATESKNAGHHRIIATLNQLQRISAIVRLVLRKDLTCPKTQPIPIGIRSKKNSCASGCRPTLEKLHP